MNTREHLKKRVEEIVKPLLQGMYTHHVDTVIILGKKGVRVNLVLHKQEGITLDDLTVLHKTIRPRLELEMDRSTLTLGISSPGVNRVLKHPEECNVFEGRKVRVLQDNEWYNGVLEKSDNGNSIALTQKNGSIKYVSFGELKKVVLD